MGDAGAGLADLLEALGPDGSGAAYRETPYFEDIQRRKRVWFERVEVKSSCDATPMTMARAVREV